MKYTWKRQHRKPRLDSSFLLMMIKRTNHKVMNKSTSQHQTGNNMPKNIHGIPIAHKTFQYTRRSMFFFSFVTSAGI